MLASPGPWRLGVAVALRSRSPQTAVELARSQSIRFYSILVGYNTIETLSSYTPDAIFIDLYFILSITNNSYK